MTNNVSPTSSSYQANYPAISAAVNAFIAKYPALTDPNFKENWDPVELKPDEKETLISLINDQGPEGAHVIHFLDSAPSFGHLLAYITHINELTQVSAGPEMKSFLRLFMDRVSHRFICLSCFTEDGIVLFKGVQKCLNGLIYNFHCCFEKVFKNGEDAGAIFVQIRLPKCDDDFKVYRLAYLLICKNDICSEEDYEKLKTRISSLEVGLKNPITINGDIEVSPNEFGTMVKLLNRGFSIDQTDYSKSLEVILNFPLIEKLFEYNEPFFNCILLSLVNVRFDVELKTLPLLINADYGLDSNYNESLGDLIRSILDRYTLKGVFEINSERRFVYSVTIHRTDCKIQGEEALSIINQVLHHLPLDAKYFIAAEALTPALINALPKQAISVEIKESAQPKPWAIKADLIRHFNACKKFRIPAQSITNETALQEIDFAPIERLVILSPANFVDLTQEQLQQYDKFMGVIPQGKGMIKFPVETNKDSIPLTKGLPELITTYPKLSFTILKQWLTSNFLPKSQSELPIFVSMLKLCMGNELLHRYLSDFETKLHDLPPKDLEPLLCLIMQTPDLKNSLYRCPNFAVQLLECWPGIQSGKGDAEWLELFEYVLRKQFLTPYSLERRIKFQRDPEKGTWGQSIVTLIFERLIKSESTTFANQLVPVASDICLFVQKMFKPKELKKGFALLLNQGWEPSLSKLSSFPLHYAMLSHIKKSLPFTKSQALPWFFNVYRAMPLMDKEEQEDFLLIFKHIYSEQKNPLFPIDAGFAKRLQKNSIILEGLLEEYPRSLHLLENAFPLGLAIVEAVFILASSEPSWFMGKKQQCVLLLNSLRLKLVDVRVDLDFTGDLAALNLLKNNVYMVRSLLPHACVLSKKGKIKTIHPFAASLLTRICISDYPDSLNKDAKIFAAILLDHGIRSYDNFQNILTYSNWEELGTALLSRIVEHSPILTGLSINCWEMILKAAKNRILNLIQEPMQGKETEAQAFLSPLILCLIKYEECMQSQCWWQFYPNLCYSNLSEIMKSTLTSLINDPNLLKKIKSGEVRNVRLLILLLNNWSKLDEAGQLFLYKVWKKHVGSLSINQEIVFPLNHSLSCQKILAFIAKNPNHFKVHKQQITLFLKQFCTQYPDKDSSADLSTIIHSIPIE